MIYKIYGKNNGTWYEVDKCTDKEEAILKGKNLEGYDNYMVAKTPLDDDFIVIGIPNKESKVKSFKSKYKVKTKKTKTRKTRNKQELEQLTREYIDR